MDKSIGRTQRGSMLLEALISILIFSIGILAIVGLQAGSVKLSTDAQYRTEASLLASQQINAMWANVAAATTLVNAAGTPVAFDPAEFDTFDSPAGANYLAWHGAIAQALPNATTEVSHRTTVYCGGVLGGVCVPGMPGQQDTRTDVNIKITWQLPGGGAVHTYETSALITAQKML